MIVHGLGVVVAGAFALLGYLSSPDGDMPLTWFYLLMAFVFSVSVFIALADNKYIGTADRKGWQSFWVVLGWPILFRLIGVYFGPIFEDDHFRFLWDGYTFATFGSPYGIAPDVFFGDPSVADQFQPILDGINNPDVATIYGPITQLSFLAAYFIAPAEVSALQMLYVLLDIIVIQLLRQIALYKGVILYAWSPLIIKEFAFTAHPDIVGVVFLVASLWCLKKDYQYWALTFIAVSFCAKVFAILLIPLIVIRCHWKTWWILPVVISAVYMPFLLLNHADLYGLFAFAKDWQFNGSVFAILTRLMQPHQAKLLCAIVFSFLYALYWFVFLVNRQSLPRGDWVFGLFFLLAPVLNAWYLIWLVIFAVIKPTRWAWLATFLVCLSYINGYNLLDSGLELYEQPLWARLIEYIPVIVVLLYESYILWSKNPTKRNQELLNK